MSKRQRISFVTSLLAFCIVGWRIPAYGAGFIDAGAGRIIEIP